LKSERDVKKSSARFSDLGNGLGFSIVRAEFEGGIYGARKDAIRFFVETRADGSNCAGEEDVVFDVEVINSETGFDGREEG